MSPMAFRLCSQDLGNPADVRFLNVLQGESGAGIKQAVALVQSSAGTPFDGAQVGTTAVLFRHDLAASFTGVTFTVPASTTAVYVTGLTPGAAYTVARSSIAGGVQYTVAPGPGSAADAGGVLVL
jgi:hypothetical protein